MALHRRPPLQFNDSMPLFSTLRRQQQFLVHIQTPSWIPSHPKWTRCRSWPQPRVSTHDGQCIVVQQFRTGTPQSRRRHYIRVGANFKRHGYIPGPLSWCDGPRSTPNIPQYDSTSHYNCLPSLFLNLRTRPPDAPDKIVDKADDQTFDTEVKIHPRRTGKRSLST